MKDLNHIGIYNEYLPVDLFNKLKEQINLLKGKINHQSRLSGNIKEEWNLGSSILIFNNYILSLINKNKIHLDFLKKEKQRAMRLPCFSGISSGSGKVMVSQ